MAKLKFVPEKGPRDHALKLAKLQQMIAKRREKLRELEKEADQLERYLLRVNRGKSFEFNGPLYKQCVLITHPSRRILDQDECRRLLKSRTPYRETKSTKVEIDYVYEKE